MWRKATLLQFGLAMTGTLLYAPWLVGQPSPAAVNGQPQPRAMLVDGRPALALDYGDGMGFLIVYSKWHDDPALRFSVHVSEAFGLTGRECTGFIWISKDRVAWLPEVSANPKCNQVSHDVPGPWWPEAYFNRGLLLEDRGSYAETVQSLKLYLLAAPNATDATQVQQKIYMLEYKAREAEAQK